MQLPSGVQRKSGSVHVLLCLLLVCLTPVCCQQIWPTSGNQDYGSSDSYDDHPNLDNHPNFVFLLTDDQENVPDEGTPGMRYTFPMMREFGTTLQNFFSNVPICCPSRTTLFTGRYPHRWFVPRDDACMHMNVSSQDFANANMGVIMKQYGYTTGCFGKTLNFELKTQYCSETSETAEVFPGWDSSFTLCNEFLFNNNVWNVNGSMLHTTDYMTSLIGNHSLAFINSSLQSGKPFFAYIGVHAPHLYSEPAPWYKDEFPDLVAPQTPNFNFSGSTHHYLVRSQPPLSKKDSAFIDGLYRNRTRSLLSVDDIIMDVIKMLEDHNQLHNTYVIWTSDHGYQLGQFRLPVEKEQPYEHVIRIPFFIRGPGIQEGAKLPFVASIVDVLPTIIELAGGVVPMSMDGHSFANELKNGNNSTLFRTKHLVEYWSVNRSVANFSNHLFNMDNNTFFGVRLLNATHNYLYVEYYANRLEQLFEYPMECELFDLNKDKEQMWNLCGVPEAHIQGDLNRVLVELRDHLHSQIHCSGQIECVL